jgi:hypothetical protein
MISIDKRKDAPLQLALEAQHLHLRGHDQPLRFVLC